MFVVGINTNLRASDLTRVMFGQVRGLKPGELFDLREKKTGKVRPVVLNSDCTTAVGKWLATRPRATDEEPLFVS